MALLDTKVERVLIAGLTAAEAANRGNYVLLYKELFIETDTKKMKLGDGKTKYRDLPYLPYSQITQAMIILYNQAVLDGRSWVNSPAFTITNADITNWNTIIPEDDIIAYAVAL